MFITRKFPCLMRQKLFNVIHIKNRNQPGKFGIEFLQRKYFHHTILSFLWKALS